MATRKTTKRAKSATKSGAKKSGARKKSAKRAGAKAASTRAPKLKVYKAMASASVAKKKGAARPFTITVRFRGGLTTTQQNAFKKAADRWAKVIVGDLPSVTIGGELIDDVLIEAEGVNIDGVGKILGQAGPTHLRPKSAGAAAFIPAKGIMSFDSADLGSMQADGTLNDVITHEMGHVLGIGTIWTNKGFLKGAGTSNPTFTGPAAMQEYGRLKGKNAGATPVPVENTGGAGTADSHWRETVFQRELMTGFVGDKPNPMSRMTVASLEDLGYKVDLKKAEPYKLPNLPSIAESGSLGSHTAPLDRGVVLPIIPTVLPDASMNQ